MAFKPYQPTPPNCIEIRVDFELFGVPFYIILYVCLNTQGIPTTSDLRAALNAFIGVIADTIMPVLSYEVTLTGGRAVATGIQDGPVVVALRQPPVAGAVQERAFPIATTLKVTYSTAKRGRSFRGATFFSGLPLQDETNNAILQANVSGAISAYSAAIAYERNVNGRVLVVMSRQYNNVRRPVAEANEVTSVACDFRWHQQRRRNRVR